MFKYHLTAVLCSLLLPALIAQHEPSKSPVRLQAGQCADLATGTLFELTLSAKIEPPSRVTNVSAGLDFSKPPHGPMFDNLQLQPSGSSFETSANNDRVSVRVVSMISPTAKEGEYRLVNAGVNVTFAKTDPVTGLELANGLSTTASDGQLLNSFCIRLKSGYVAPKPPTLSDLKIDGK